MNKWVLACILIVVLIVIVYLVLEYFGILATIPGWPPGEITID